jgi:DTW domain-containing protein YfiP
MATESAEATEVTTTTTTTTMKKRRHICTHCHRPICLCHTLPNPLIQLKNCHCIVLQHPHEIHMKHNTLSLIQLCFHPSCITTIIRRRFGTSTIKSTSTTTTTTTTTNQSESQISSSNQQDHHDSLSNIILSIHHSKKKKNHKTHEKHNKQDVDVAKTATEDEQFTTTRTTTSSKRVTSSPTSSRPEIISSDDVGHDNDKINHMNHHHNTMNKHQSNDTSILQNLEVWLVFPSNDAIPFKDALIEYQNKISNKQQNQQQQQQQQNHSSASLLLSRSTTNHNVNDINDVNDVDSDTNDIDLPFIYLIFIDATWKYANEMNQSNILYHQYPHHMKCIYIDQIDTNHVPNYHPNRYNVIRTSLSQHHLSTAECIAYVVHMIETTLLPIDKHNNKQQRQQQQVSQKQQPHDSNHDNDMAHHHPIVLSIYELVMKPMDFVVQQCQSFMEQKSQKVRMTKQKHRQTILVSSSSSS